MAGSPGAQRIVDVEKEALVVLLEALDALGDRHAVFAFSGQGPRHVRVLTVKGFDEAGGVAIRRRVAALEPDGYTRVGAAIRHASALLAEERARHRLLLILSDGKPNDVDEYAGRYGIEDTRQAVAEARLQGLVPFCLTVDREAPAYMPSIFGRGFALLRCQELLPGVLVEVVAETPRRVRRLTSVVRVNCGRPVSPRRLRAVRHQHHRDRRRALDGLGHAAPQRPVQTSPPMSGHGDEVDARGLRRLDDLLCGLAEADGAVDLDAGQGKATRLR